MVDSVAKCNPGNIRTGQPWQGLADEQDDTGFCTFESAEYGIRAIMVILDNYAKQGINTVQGIINRWAPPTENDTGAYIADVAQRVGVKPTDTLIHPQRGTMGKGVPNPPSTRAYTQDRTTMMGLVKAIIHHEIGKQPYAQVTFDRAWDLFQS